MSIWLYSRFCLSANSQPVKNCWITIIKQYNNNKSWLITSTYVFQLDQETNLARPTMIKMIFHLLKNSIQSKYSVDIAIYLIIFIYRSIKLICRNIFFKPGEKKFIYKRNNQKYLYSNVKAFFCKCKSFFPVYAYILG